MNKQDIMDEEKSFLIYADSLKFSAAVAITEQFSTREDAPTTLAKVFCTIGREVNLLINADEVYHLFLNPDLKEVHRLKCNMPNNNYERLDAEITGIDLYKKNDHTWFYHVDDSIDKSNLIAQKQPFLEQLKNLIYSPPFYALAPFCWRDYPLGYFIFVWHKTDAVPLFFKKEKVRLRESSISILHYLQALVTALFTNHYPIYRDTYLPKYMEVIPKRVAVLFADIRNFTSAFEAIRLHAPKRPELPNPLVGLVKAYLAAASGIIAGLGIGRIDKFIGDGIMALFGEYLLCKNDQDSTKKYTSSCLLALYTASMLNDAFEKLFKYFLSIKEIKTFLLDYTEDFNLKIGCGINFGEVHFDYFGTSIVPPQGESKLIGGYLEYTAVGDHVNTAQRLEGIANKPMNAINLIERSKYRSERNQNFTAPIIVSRPVFLRIKDFLRDIPGTLSGVSIDDYYKATAMLKGKGSLIDIYEIYPNEIKGRELLKELKEAGLERLESGMSSSWDNDNINKIFRFHDAEAKRLIKLYCKCEL